MCHPKDSEADDSFSVLNGQGNPLNRPHFGHIYKMDYARVCTLFQVGHPCLIRSLEGILTLSLKSVEDQMDDVDEIINQLNRWKEMTLEDLSGTAYKVS